MKKTLFFILILNFFLVFVGTSSQNLNTYYFLNDTIQSGEKLIEQYLKKADEIYASNISEAINLSVKALKVAENLESDELIADCSFMIGKLYLYTGIFDEALIYTEKANSLFKSLGDDDKTYETVFEIGRIYWGHDEFIHSKKYFEEYYKYAVSKKDTSMIVKSLNSLGSVYGNTGKMDSAMILFQEVCSMSKLSGDRHYEILGLFNIGDVLLFSDKPEEALKKYQEIESNYKPEDIDYKHWLYLYNSKTYAYVKLGNTDSAELYSTKTWNKLQENILYTELRKYYDFKHQINVLEEDYKTALDCYVKYTNLSDSLKQSNFERQLANFESLYNLERKEKELQSYKYDNELKGEGIKRRNIVIYGGIVLIFLLAFLVIQVSRSIKRTKKTNYTLHKQKEELATANEEILAQTDDLNETNIELGKLVDKLKETQEHLVQSEKMASIGTLTAGIAHEINNPLNFISGGLLILSRIRNNANAGLNKEQSDLLEKASEVIEAGLERTIKVTRALMTFSYSGKPILVNTDINKLINDTLIVLNSKIDDTVRIEKEFEIKNEVPVYIDKINQVILNIVDNAIYAVSLNNNSDKVIRISTEELKESVNIKVYNSGPEFSKKELKQIFDPFFTTKDPGIGTGLGLSICYNLVSEHKGKITVENYDEGVLFTINLPKKK